MPMTYKAILIGNWTYDQTKTGLQSLNGPEYDLKVLRNALTDRECGLFDDENITLVSDQDNQAVRDQVADFLSGSDKDDALLIYFSGHAVPTPRDLVLCQKDTDPTRPLARGLPVSFISSSLPEARSEHTIVILDCCYAGQSTKGAAAVDLSLAQNLYWVASSGPYDLTPDAKSRDEASPFTKRFADLLVDKAVVADHRGAVTMDAIWTNLESFKTKPRRNAAGRQLLIARRGELRTEDAKYVSPLEWLPKNPTFWQVDVALSSDGIVAKTDADTWPIVEPDPRLREFTVKGMELLDGVGRLKEEDGVDQWRDSVRGVWRLLGTTLSGALPKDLRNIIAERVENQEDNQLVKLTIHSLDQRSTRGSSDLDSDQPRVPSDLDQYPWEGLHGAQDDPESIQDFLSLTEGVVVERVCESSRSFPDADPKLPPYSIWSTYLGDQADKRITEQIVKELDARRADMNLDVPPRNFLGKDCTWSQFLGAPAVQFLVLTVPLRRRSDGGIEVGFNSTKGMEWKRSGEVVDRLSRLKVRLRAVVIETVAIAPSFNAYRAGVEFARQIARAGLGPAAYVCHAAQFPGYPLDGRGVPVTFAGQVICSILNSAAFALAIHHARSAPLRWDSGIKDTFGFPGGYSARLNPSNSTARLATPSYPSPGPSASPGKDDRQGGGKETPAKKDDNG